MAEIRRKSTWTGFFRTNRIDLARLQGAQQFDLRVEGQLANLVEEQGAAVGLLELAGPLVDRAGKRAPLVAEQNTFHQVFRDGTAVHRDEGPFLALALALDGPGDQLLADPTLALDQDRNIGSGRAVAKLNDAPHGFAANDEVAERQRTIGLPVQARKFALQCFDFERAFDRYL